MARLKFLRRRSKDKKISFSEEEQNAHEEETKKPPKPARGLRRIISYFKLYFPLGTYQRSIKWQLEESLVTINHENVSSSEIHVESKNQKSKERENIILVEEKPFRTRFSYFLTRTFLQSFGLAIIFTAPLSLPWIFNVVIPYSIDILPLGLANLLREIINSILGFFKPLEIVVVVIMNLSAFFGTYNPIFFYGTMLLLFTWLGLSDAEFLDSIENIESTGTGSMIEVLANTYSAKFALIQSVIVPFVIIIAGTISFFLVVRRARTILFEIQSEKEQKKNVNKVKRSLISHYMDKGYSEVEYIENRVNTSPKLKWLAKIIKYGPIVSVILPISLAIIFVIL
ncbi:MAG: hypothetical protein ACFE95_00705 [Candidatus Hodarchaeota archaeon]